jgi:tellurium resistance protein TerD
MLDMSGRVLSDSHFVFFNNLKSPDGSVEHMGDNLTGGVEGDDEQVKVNLAAVPAECGKVVFPVSIYEAEQRQQNFGQVRNAFIRVVNQADNSESERYDLTEHPPTEPAMVFGEIYRSFGEWSSAPSARATPPASVASRRTSASTSADVRLDSYRGRLP